MSNITDFSSIKDDISFLDCLVIFLLFAITIIPIPFSVWYLFFKYRPKNNKGPVILRNIMTV